MNLHRFLIEEFNKKNEIVKDIKQVKTSGNKTFIIITDKSKYVLRLCGSFGRYRSYREILSEIALLKFLNKNNIPAPNPIKLGNQFVIPSNKGNGFCYKYLEGEITDESNLSNYFSAGEMLGKIHNLTINFEYPFKRKSWGLENCKRKFYEIEKYLLRVDEFREYNFSAKIKGVLENLNFPQELPQGAIHEDFGKRHVLFNGENISGVLDWDRSYYGDLILDIGQAIRGWCFSEWEYFDKKKFHAVLKGYETQRKITSLEKKYLKSSVKFAFAERAVSFAINFLNNKNKDDLEFAIKNLSLATKF